MRHLMKNGYPPIPSNNAGLECIKVRKVYDWVVIPTTLEEVRVDVPKDCLQKIAGANIGIKCCPCTQPLPPSSIAKACSIKRNIPGCSKSTALVNIYCNAFFQLLFFDQNFPDNELCCVQGCIPVKMKKIVLCLPEPLNCDNITCGIISCEGFGVLTEENCVEIDLTVCVEVEVELDVKLEVEGKFCQPRAPMKPPPTTCPISVPFPPQCDFFPVKSCDCQAAILSMHSVTPEINGQSTNLGTAVMKGKICPFCNPEASTFSYDFKEDNYPPTDDQFHFCSEPGQIHSPNCNEYDFMMNQGTITITGQGTLMYQGVKYENETFELTLTRSLMGCSYTLIITGASPTISIINPIDCSNINIKDCITLDEI